MEQCAHICIADGRIPRWAVAVNYTGHPFMASLTSNTGLTVTLALGGALTILLALGALPSLAAYLELAPLYEVIAAAPAAAAATRVPSSACRAANASAAASDDSHAGLGSDMVSLMGLDLALCFLIEKGVTRLSRLTLAARMMVNG